MLYFDRLKMAEKADALNNEAAGKQPRPERVAIEEKPEVQTS